MDKFGIFKLLTTFFSFYQNQQQNGNTPDLSSVLQQFIKKPATQHENDTLSQQKTNGSEQTLATKPTAPLTQKMLYTMNSHDEFIKRVMDANKKN